MKTLFLCLALAGATVQAQPLAPIFDGPTGMFLGASKGRKWLAPEKAAPLLPKIASDIRFYSANGLLKTGMAMTPKSMDAPCPDTLFSTFAPAAPAKAEFAIGGNFAPMPRRIRVENSQSPVYRKIVGEILKKNGLSSPVQIQQLWRVDLEGDGTQEILLSATRKHDYGDPNRIAPDARAGDYSLVLLRKIVGGQVKNILLYASFHRKNSNFSAPNFYRLAAVFDANGDRKMEISLRGAYYEGGWVSLFELQNGVPKTVLEVGCGA